MMTSVSQTPSGSSKLTRRAALVALLAAPMAQAEVIGQGKRKGHLTVPLDQWETLTVELGGKSVTLTAADIFAALKETK